MTPDTVKRMRAATRRAVLEKKALDNVGSEIAGGMLTPAISTVGGSAIGALAGGVLARALKRDVAYGAGSGAGLGAAVGLAAAPVATAGGVLAGILRRRRTKQEQQEHDSKSHWENFIPGVAAYNYTKRKGRVLAGVGEPDEKKAAEAAYIEGFCKAAEAAGVDPVALYKAAGIGSFVGKGIGLGLRGLGRASGAMSRGATAAADAVKARGLMGAARQGLSAARTGIENAARPVMNEVASHGGLMGTARSGYLRAKGGLQNFVRDLTGANVTKFKGMEDSMHKLVDRAGQTGDASLLMRADRGIHNARRAADAAQQATIRARGIAATGAGAVAGGLAIRDIRNRIQGGQGAPQAAADAGQGYAQYNV